MDFVLCCYIAKPVAVAGLYIDSFTCEPVFACRLGSQRSRNDDGMPVVIASRYEKTHSEYITKLPTGKHSTKGLGKTHPDPKEVSAAAPPSRSVSPSLSLGGVGLGRTVGGNGLEF